MLLADRLNKEGEAIISLIQLSSEKAYHKVKKKQWDEELIRPWWSNMLPITTANREPNHLQLFENSHSKNKTQFKGVKDSPRRTSKLNSNELKFFNFDDVHEYITHYREVITLPAVMEYRKKLLSLSTDKLSLCAKCAKKYTPHDLVKHCHCLNTSRKSSNNLNSSSICYGTESPRSSSSRTSPCASANKERRCSGSRHRQLGWKSSSNGCERNHRTNSDRNKRTPSNYDRLCTPMALHKKDKGEVKIDCTFYSKFSKIFVLRF